MEEGNGTFKSTLIYTDPKEGARAPPARGHSRRVLHLRQFSLSATYTLVRQSPSVPCQLCCPEARRLGPVLLPGSCHALQLYPVLLPLLSLPLLRLPLPQPSPVANLIIPYFLWW